MQVIRMKSSTTLPDCLEQGLEKFMGKGLLKIMVILVTINSEGTGRSMIPVAMSEMADQKFAHVRSLAKRIRGRENHGGLDGCTHLLGYTHSELIRGGDG